MTHEKRIQARVPDKLHTQFKLACIRNGEDMNNVLNRFIEAYVTKSLSKENSK